MSNNNHIGPQTPFDFWLLGYVEGVRQAEKKEKKMDVKHTPGPWTYDRHIWWENTPGEQEKHGLLIIFPPADEDLTIAEVNDLFDKEVGRANAALIAAAPDLLAACEGLLSADLYADGEGLVSFVHPNTEEGDLAANRARAAIAKAKGE